MVKLTIQNRQAQIEVPPYAPALLIRELKEAPRDRKKVKNILHNGNLTWEQILKVAAVMRPKSGARDFEGTVKEVVGSAMSVGCTIEKVHPR